MSNDLLGHTPAINAERDAVHVAILPIVATTTLYPGQRVTLKGVPYDGGDAIVDPFKQSPTFPGEHVYICLFPGTVTDMRHHWLCPELDDVEAISKNDLKNESEIWLRDWIRVNDCPDFETIVAAINGNFVEAIDGYASKCAYELDDDYFMFWGRDAHSEIPDEFWSHMEVYLGHNISTKPKSFSCSC